MTIYESINALEIKTSIQFNVILAKVAVLSY